MPVKRITVLLGNGFDLSCGLKTRYVDMYEEYSRQDSKDQTIAVFKKMHNDHETWMDFEKGMRDYMGHFITEKAFIEALRDFREYMTKYLKKQERLFMVGLEDDTVKEQVDEVIKESLSIIKKEAGFEEEDVEWKFITFNYTKTADELLQKYGEVTHIHGIINGSPVLGINDETQFLPDLKYEVGEKLKIQFLKPVFNRCCNPEADNKAIAAIDGSNAIALYGISLGMSDLRWGELIAEWLKRDKANKLVLFSYEYMSKYDKHDADIREARMDEENKLGKKLGIDIEDYKEQIEIPMLRSLFNVAPAVKKSIKTKRNKRWIGRIACFVLAAISFLVGIFIVSGDSIIPFLERNYVVCVAGALIGIASLLTGIFAFRSRD